MKTAIVTGTSKGIGKEIAGHLLDQGFAVAGCSRGDATIKHKEYSHYSLQVSDETAVRRMFMDFSRRHGQLDVLINNAGIASMNHIMTTSFAAAERVINTNFLGSFLFLREASKVMARQNYGRIVNFSTVAVGLSLDGEAVYASSKAAVEKLTQIAAKELGELGITVNGIAPTPVMTDLIKAVPKDKIDALLAKQAIKRFGKFEDIINIIDFYLDEKSNFVTGQIIYLGGVNG